jgi:hypothetical protein
MLHHSNLVHSTEFFSQEIEVYRRQKILFILIDILLVSQKMHLLINTKTIQSTTDF